MMVLLQDARKLEFPGKFWRRMVGAVPHSWNIPKQLIAIGYIERGKLPDSHIRKSVQGLQGLNRLRERGNIRDIKEIVERKRKLRTIEIKMDEIACNDIL